MTVDTEFWNFSLTVYAQDGVPAECLNLQDSYRVNVNLLLFCAWLGATKGVVLSSREIAAAANDVDRWQTDIVAKIRGVRRALKPLGVEAFRAKIKAAELEAERIEQAILLEWAETNFGGGERASSKDALQKNMQALFAFYKINAVIPARLFQAAESVAAKN
jgi:uncharacterized protein (TIGR02444 family)